MVRFFNRFPISIGTNHSDLLVANALALAAREALMDLTVDALDESTVSVTLPNGHRVVGSDWDNISSAIMRAAA